LISKLLLLSHKNLPIYSVLTASCHTVIVGRLAWSATAIPHDQCHVTCNTSWRWTIV